jgi:hypothetical protein
VSNVADPIVAGRAHPYPTRTRGEIDAIGGEDADVEPFVRGQARDQMPQERPDATYLGSLAQ